MLHNTNSHDLLAIVAAVHHQRVCQPLNNWALSLAEPLSRIPSSSVGKIYGVLCMTDGKVISQRNVIDLQIKTLKRT